MMAMENAGLLLGAGSQLLWGCHPPLTRYLQTVAGMSTCGLMATSNLMALLFIFLNDALVMVKRRTEDQQRAGGPRDSVSYAQVSSSNGDGQRDTLANGHKKETEMVVPDQCAPELDDFPMEQDGEESAEGDALLTVSKRTGGLSTDSEEREANEARPILKILRENWREMGALVVSVFLRSMTNMASTRFAPAAWVQMVNLSTPIFVALISYIRGESDIPMAIIPTILASSVGSYLVISDRAIVDGDESSSSDRITAREVLGLGLALCASLFLSIYMIVIKVTKGMIDERQLLIVSSLTLMVPTFTYSTIFEGSWVSTFAAFTAIDWAALIGFGVGTYAIASALQQISIRMNGAPMHAALLPCRLISSVVGGYLILGEKEKGVEGYIGLVLVGTTMAVFLWSRMRKPPTASIELRADVAGATSATAEEESDAQADDKESSLP